MINNRGESVRKYPRGSFTTRLSYRYSGLDSIPVVEVYDLQNVRPGEDLPLVAIVELSENELSRKEINEAISYAYELSQRGYTSLSALYRHQQAWKSRLSEEDWKLFCTVSGGEVAKI